MLIILEGPDGVGKSTLAGRLKDHLRREPLRPGQPEPIVSVWHRGPPRGHPLDEYERPLWDYIPGTNQHIICDRWHLGEWVYPKVLDRETQLDNAAWYHIELFLRSRGALLVHVTGDPDVTAARIDPTGSHLNHPHGMWMIRHRWVIRDQFLRAEKRSILPKYRCVGTFADPPAVKPILAAAHLADSMATSRPQWKTYIGSNNPKLMLFGERRGNDPAAAEGPAFGPYPGTSGRWLLNSLATLGRDWMNHVGILNACEEEDVYFKWQEMGSPPCIALGNNAGRCLQRDDVERRVRPLALVPHPQYCRRFQNQKVEEYALLIARSAGRWGRQSWDLQEGWPKL